MNRISLSQLIFWGTKVRFVLIALLLSGCVAETHNDDWEVYKSDAASSSYSGLAQINKENVSQLEVAWTYRTGDLMQDPDDHPRTGIETNPIIVDDILYGVSPHMKIFALDAITGKNLWTFDPFKNKRAVWKLRSVVYWEDGEDKLILFTAGTWLYALDAETGKQVVDFGHKGRVSLNIDLGRDPNSISVMTSSPGMIYQDLIILGSAVGEAKQAAPGDIRAFNVRTGEIVWTFHTIPQPGESGFQTWGLKNEKSINEYLNKQGGANNWAGMSLDKERGIVYIPTGSPNYDFYGGGRAGKNLYGNSLLALDAATGKYIWHYQIVHHDLWDYDLPAPPNLLTIKKNGNYIDAVAQVTKHGFVFVFDRVSGEPVFPINERSVPPSRIESESAWPTQPFPTKPEPFARQYFSSDEVTDILPEAHDSVLAELEEYRNEGLFTPPDFKGTVVLPGLGGGANWGGAAHDPENGILYINSKEIPMISTVQEIRESSSSTESLFERGKTFYLQNCATCHGLNKEGQPPSYPALTNIQDERSKQEVLSIVEEGGSMMPAFSSIGDKEKEAILAYLFNRKNNSEDGHNYDKNVVGVDKEHLNVQAHNQFRGPDGYPAIKPPWGTLNAIDLNSGEIKWKVPLGAYPELLEKGIPPTGMPSMGGPIATGGGLVFIAGTEDQKFRAFDKDTGELLWQTALPAAGFATPATYMSGDRQYVVIAAGGGRGTPPGDYYVAFALPD